jgi:hypothetical protein
MRRVLAQTKAETAMTLSRGESLLLALGIPVLLLVFFSLVDVLPTGTGDPVTFLAPGILALAVMSTAMVSLAIATGFERQYLVLKRLGTTPLGRPALLTAKIASIVAVEAAQTVVLVAVAIALGCRQRPLSRPPPPRRHGGAAEQAAGAAPGGLPSAPSRRAVRRRARCAESLCLRARQSLVGARRLGARRPARRRRHLPLGVSAFADPTDL